MLFVYLLILIVVFSAFMVGMTKFTVWITGRAVGKTVNKVHRDAEYIINTGLLPDVWISQIGSGWNLKKYQRYIEKKFKTMNHHFQNAPVFEDEETRELLLSNLENKKKGILKKEFFEGLEDK